MITVGGHFRGPEVDDLPIGRTIARVMEVLMDARGNWELGSSPGVNVVFYVPGSLGTFDIDGIHPGRFSRKRRLLLVEVAVPVKIAKGENATEFVIKALYEANAIAEEVFVRKRVSGFDRAKADAIIDSAKENLIFSGEF